MTNKIILTLLKIVICAIIIINICYKGKHDLIRQTRQIMSINTKSHKNLCLVFIRHFAQWCLMDLCPFLNGTAADEKLPEESPSPWFTDKSKDTL